MEAENGHASAVQGFACALALPATVRCAVVDSAVGDVEVVTFTCPAGTVVAAQSPANAIGLAGDRLDGSAGSHRPDGAAELSVSEGGLAEPARRPARFWVGSAAALDAVGMPEDEDAAVVAGLAADWVYELAGSHGVDAMAEPSASEAGLIERAESAATF